MMLSYYNTSIILFVKALLSFLEPWMRKIDEWSGLLNFCSSWHNTLMKAILAKLFLRKVHLYFLLLHLCFVAITYWIIFFVWPQYYRKFYSQWYRILLHKPLLIRIADLCHCLPSKQNKMMTIKVLNEHQCALSLLLSKYYVKDKSKPWSLGSKYSGGSKGAPGTRAPPLGPLSFIFMRFKIWPK